MNRVKTISALNPSSMKGPVIATVEDSVADRLASMA